jgi:TolA-binding protein
VNRYVTEGSFDAYMWQTLETKAKFISQVMTGQTVARRIEDLDSPALTYAEVKAIASGNPLVIEKAKVDAEVMRLSRLRSEHSESQYGTRSRLRMAGEDVARLERQVAAMEQDKVTCVDTQGEKFRMVVGQKTYTERAEAGAALVYLAAEHRDDHLGGRAGTVVLGELAGFKLEYRSTWPDKVTLRGAAEHVANISPSPIGSISSLEHAARSIEEHVLRLRDELARCRMNLAELTALTGKIFEHAERYRELLKRQGELVDLLDITKNQAAAQQATESTGDVETGSVETPENGVSTDVESSEESPTSAVAVAAVESKPIIRRLKTRTPAKGQTTKSTSPTVRLAPQEPARMKIAV